jgi:hypothetical protein
VADADDTTWTAIWAFGDPASAGTPEEAAKKVIEAVVDHPEIDGTEVIVVRTAEIRTFVLSLKEISVRG